MEGADESTEPETIVYLERPSVHYPPISDALVNKEYLFCIVQMIQLWHYWEIAFSISINRIFFHGYKKHQKWRDGGWCNEESFSDYPNSALWLSYGGTPSFVRSILLLVFQPEKWVSLVLTLTAVGIVWREIGKYFFGSIRTRDWLKKGCEKIWVKEGSKWLVGRRGRRNKCDQIWRKFETLAKN